MNYGMSKFGCNEAKKKVGALFYLTFGLFTTSGIILCMCTILMSNERQRSIYDTIYIF